MLHFVVSAVLAVSMAVAAGGAAAQHALHDGDIEMAVVDGKIVLEGAEHAESGTGRLIFESDWPNTSVLAGPRFAVDEPGFDSPSGTFAPDTELYFGAWGTLAFWDGDSWESVVPHNEVVNVVKFFDTQTVSTSGITASPGFSGLLGAAGPDGVIHEHLAFVLQNQPLGGSIATGAYRIGLELTSPTLESSGQFYIVFNRGLSAEAFEESVHAMAVPEPETWATLAAGLGLLALVGVRQRRG